MRRIARRTHHAQGLGKTPAELDGIAAELGAPSRRGFLAALGATALVPMIGGCGDNKIPNGDAPKIAIIGGGIAGMTAAHFLALAGIRGDIYEASMRIGGRMYTSRGQLQGGQICELGGELVDSNHIVIPLLARTYGFSLDDLVAATDGLKQDTFNIKGEVQSDTAIVAAFTAVAMKMATAVAAGDADATEFDRIDNMSISEWLATEAGLPATNMIRQLLEVAYLEEFGLEVDQQSAWNLITLIDYANPDPFHVFGDSDEHYHVHQGNDSIPNAIAAKLPDQVNLDHALTKVVANTGGFDLTFATGGGEVVVSAAHVIYALPFTKLRDVDLSEAMLSAGKLDIIKHLGYGTNAKLMMQFTERHWELAQMASGSAITDAPYTAPGPGKDLLQSTWATSRGQDGPQGILTNFVGGNRGIAIGQGTAESQAQIALPLIDLIYPGTSSKYIAGSAIRQHWPSYPFTKGSYASYLKGQWSFFGMEGKREGNQHFCGEHCSENFQGYMEGGAETGALVAGEVLDDLGIGQPPVLAGLISTLTASPRASYHAGFGERMRLAQIRR